MGYAHGNKQNAQREYRENQIYGRPGERNKGTLPTRLAHQFIGRSGGRVFASVHVGHILTGHAHVAAKWEGTNAPIRVAAFPSKEARTKADGENVHANFEEPGHNEMAPLVNHDHQTEYQR